MVVRVTVTVIMTVVMPAVGAMHMRGSGRFGVAVVTMLLIAMIVAAMVMTGMRGCAVGPALGFKSLVHRIHNQVHGA